MPSTRPVCLALAAAAAAAAPASSYAELSASVSLTSDYIWRGFSKSSGDAALQVTVDAQHRSGLYGGVFASSVDVDYGDGYRDGYAYAARPTSPADSAALEVVPYVGYSLPLSEDVRLDTQWSLYLFDDDIFGNSSSYQEAYAFLHYRDLLTAELAFAPDAYDQNAATVNAQLTGRYPLSAAVSVSAGGGWFEASEALGYDYLHWHAGLTWYHRYGGVDLRYFGASERGEAATPWPYDPPAANGELVITVTFGF